MRCLIVVMSFLTSIHLLLILLFHCQPTYSSSSPSSSSSSNFFPSNSSSFSFLPPQLWCRRSEECCALLNFKNSFSTTDSTASEECDESFPKTDSWKENTDCCTWDGVTCNDNEGRPTGHVIGLDLSCSRITSGTTSHSNNTLFLRLPHLQRLNLAYNNFYGSQQFGTSLTHLNLSRSGYSLDPFPAQLSHLSKLVSLDLSNNYNRPKLGKQNFKRLVQNLTELRELVLDFVDMSSIDLGSSLRNFSSSFISLLGLSYCLLQGRLQADHIFRLPNLQMLYLDNNYYLNGYFPKGNSSSPLRILDLSFTSFSGKLPNTIGNLKSLSYLDISVTSFSGKLPNTIGNLKSLSYLRISDTSFSGKLPNSIGNLKSLSFLDLSNCAFYGPLPASLGNLTQLTFLKLHANQFSGEIQWSMSNLVHLQRLDLSRNNLSGQLPSSILNLTQLQYLELSFNQFVGSIPSGVILPPPNLFYLRFNDNQLSGTIPYWLYRLQSLETLNLSNNQLTGGIKEFQCLTLLEIYLNNNELNGGIEGFRCRTLLKIDLSNNELQGPIPRSIFQQVNLTHLNLSFNNLSGSMDVYVLPELNQIEVIQLSNNQIGGLIPKWLWDCGQETFRVLKFSHNVLEGFHIPSGILLPSSLTVLDLQSNRLHGSLPIPSPSSYFYSVANNMLSGVVTPLICKSSSLELLDLSNNDFSGLLPPCLGNFSRDTLTVLNLHRNRFHGPIPQAFSEENVLRSLDVSENKLQGLVPRSLVNCTELEVLNLGNNDILDMFPFWLDILPKLQVLVLRSNRFHGPILQPKRKSAFSKLTIIDLSHNNFTGVMPSKFFKSLRSMTTINDGNSKLEYMGDKQNYYFDSVTVVSKGLELELVRILTIFKAIDFSNNNFEGEIPNSIGNLNSVRVLNVSGNSLRGPIPSSLGNLSVIESLDLSNNNLSGEIPKQLTSLTSLSYFDVSQNHLEGPIPYGNQFNTFSNNSYEGNSGLCGLPLTKKCGGGEKAPSPPIKAEESKSSSNFTMDIYEWIVVLMGYGCGLVIGVVGGNYIMQRKEEWIMKTFGIGQHRRGRRLNRTRQNGTRGR